MKHVNKWASVAALAFCSAVTQAAPIYASSLVASSNVTSFGSGNVTGAADGGGLFLGSTFDPPVLLGSITVSFATALGNGTGTDLTVIDVASSTNETFNVELSSDGVVFALLGEFDAVNNDVDFGAFVGPVSYIRLTNTSRQVSVDIDAIVGNYEFIRSVPEPTTMGLVGLALLGLGLRRRPK